MRLEIFARIRCRRKSQTRSGPHSRPLLLDDGGDDDDGDAVAVEVADDDGGDDDGRNC